MDDNRHWVGTWSASPAPSEAGVGFNNHTLRMNPRVSIGGDTLRVRISNAYGLRKLEIGAAYIGIQMLPIYDCGDGLHPSDLGYCKMGDVIDLALFD